MQHFFHDRARDQGKRVRTRCLLIDSAISVVGERGVLNTTIQELTREAGLSNGTFYNHFEDREQLIREAATSIGLVLAEDIAQQVSHIEEGLGRIVVSTQMFITLASAQPAWAKVLCEAANNVFEMRLDMARGMLSDIELAIGQGAPLEMPDRFKLFQIGTLIALALEARISGQDDESITRATCDAQLRLLGMTPEQARRKVATYLSQQEH
ncbi:MAG: TetR family transcriptional regulator [Pseudomonadota bacterium]